VSKVIKGDLNKADSGSFQAAEMDKGQNWFLGMEFDGIMGYEMTCKLLQGSGQLGTDEADIRGHDSLMFHGFPDGSQICRYGVNSIGLR
jgi:hypothetical protein